MSSPNALNVGSPEGVVRAIYACVANADFPGVLRRLADDVVFIQAESLPFARQTAGRFTGHAGFSEMATRIVASWPGFQVQPIAFLCDGSERVVVLTQLTGRHLDMPMLELWTVRGGLVRQCQPFYFDSAAAARVAVSAGA